LIGAELTNGRSVSKETVVPLRWERKRLKFASKKVGKSEISTLIRDDEANVSNVSPWQNGSSEKRANARNLKI